MDGQPKPMWDEPEQLCNIRNDSLADTGSKIGLLQTRIVWDTEMQAKMKAFVEAMAETEVSTI